MGSNVMTGEPTANLGMPNVGDPDDLQATTLHRQGGRLLHRPTSTIYDLPSLVRAFIIGKRSKTFQPDLDLRDFPESAFVSRNQAQLFLRANQIYVEDLDSKNGTAVNGVPLSPGQPQSLTFGDHICFGNADAFSFILIKEEPLDLMHLQGLSGKDRGFEVELLTSYMQSVTVLLERLRQTIAQMDFVEVKLLATQVAIASYNVGAEVMHVLAKQMEDQAQQKATALCTKTTTALQEGLEQVQQFMKVFYDL
jgi:pSer/pThr/pTyr-binding forkhead associated (FHA) protein